MADAWKAEILRNLTHIPKVGTPGTARCEGALPVLTGDRSTDIVIVAAELGQGRIVGLSHEAYLDGFKTSFNEDDEISLLQCNIKTWVSKGKYQTVNDAILLETPSDVDILLSSQAKIAWVQQNFTGDDNQVRGFVERGGGLVYGLCPWGYLQRHPNQTVDDFPLCNVLREAKFSFTSDYVSGNDTGFIIPSSITFIPNLRDEWSAEILKNLTHLPKLGTPGTALVRGARARPIVLGDNNSDVLLCAAEMGLGRVVAIAHENYMNGFQLSNNNNGEVSLLQANIKRWVSKGQYQNANDGILLRRSSDVDELERGNFKIAYVQQRFDGDNDAQLLKFIENGGGLVFGLCPWGFLYGTDQDETRFPLYSLFDRAGIQFTKDYIYGNDKGFDIPDKYANRGSLIVEWSDVLLKDLSHIPKLGVPGTTIVYGIRSRPIIVGAKPVDVVMTAAEVGLGRIVTFSHEAYLDNFKTSNNSNTELKQLQHNIKKWVTRGKYIDDSDVIQLRHPSDADQLNSGSFKIAFVQQRCSGLDETRVLRFIEEGGALVYGLCPWGFLSGTDLDETSFPLHGVMEAAGIFFTRYYLHENKNGFPIPCKTDMAHLPTLIESCLDSSISMGPKALALVSLLGNLPVKVEPYPFQEKLNDLAQSLQSNVNVPSEQDPLSSEDKKGPFLLACEIAKFTKGKAPGVSTFPGDFASSPTLACISVNLQSVTLDVFSAAAYLPAGRELEVTVLDGSTKITGWKVLIGAHSDNLVDKESWKRLPNIQISKHLKDGKNIISSPYGGSIYFVSPSGDASLRVSLDNVVRAPQFDLNDSVSQNAWRDNRNAPGLWCDFVGSHIMITLPSQSIRSVDDPSDIMRFWDRAVASQHELRSTDANIHRKQWIVTDVQPSAGYMHAGYPIVTHMDIAQADSDAFILNLEKVTAEGNWGLYHEIGHNMQRSEWTFTGTGEVTNNIFSLYDMYIMNSISEWIHPWLRGSMRKIEDYLTSGADFSNWKDSPGIALGIYAQLAHHLGWDLYKAVFRAYEQLPSDQKPTTDDAKMKTWIRMVSENSGKNLCPLFHFWGFNIPDDLRNSLENLPKFLPSDEMTQFAPQRMAQVKSVYGM